MIPDFLFSRVANHLRFSQDSPDSAQNVMCPDLAVIAISQNLQEIYGLYLTILNVHFYFTER